MNNSALVVGNFLSVALGTRSVCEDLSMCLNKAGWTILTSSNKLGRWARMVDMVTTAWKERQSYAVAQVDVYSGLAFAWAEAVCLTLRLAHKPYVLTLHGGNLPAFARRWPGRVKRLLHSAAAVTTPSSYLYQHMLPFRDQLRLLPNALDLGAYTYTLRNEPAPRLVWLRAFHHIYNPTLAPRVMKLLVDDYPAINLLMIGPDKGDGSMQRTHEQAGSIGVSARITFQDAIAKAAVPSWLHKGDIFLNTTNVDNTPVSVLEAMACGLCVVSTNVGGIPYLLEDGHDSLLVPPDDPQAMADAVRRILTEPGLAERLSCNARAKAAQFDWSVILPQWEALLTAIAGGHTQ